MLRTDLITIDPEITGGTPVFTGTRVPIQALFDYLGGDEPLTMFLYDFPSVSREQAEGVIQLAHKMLIPEHLQVQPAQIDFVALLARHEAAA